MFQLNNVKNNCQTFKSESRFVQKDKNKCIKLTKCKLKNKAISN